MTETSATLEAARTPRHFFKRQGLHLLLLVALCLAALKALDLGPTDGSWLGVSTKTWFIAAMVLPVIHQGLVWLVWRGQLGWGILTQWFGDRDLSVWLPTFAILIISRPLLLIALGVSDAGSLPLPWWVTAPIGVLLMIPALYTVWSVRTYFGGPRTVGGDHFRTSYREMEPVTEGAFGLTSNAMYALGFLLLWALAFMTGSRAALIIAAFQHAYIWVHYYCTELPDIHIMYGGELSKTT